MYTYISLFSSAGIGCYGFLNNDFQCVATNELLKERLEIQKVNNKCKYETGYISGNIFSQETKDKIFNEIDFWAKNEGVSDIDVVVATPPCQGMSTVNYKKNNEQSRNSLVVEAIKMILEINPKVFVFENVRAFMNTICTDIDSVDRLIGDAIYKNLGETYHISSRIINFKDYGVPSSRPRTLVIGTRKDLIHISPLNIFPDKQNEITVRDAIGDLKSLSFGEWDPDDLYHFARTYPEYMISWIKDIKEGESALNNPEETRPYKLVKGQRMPLKSTHINNKFRRLFWDKPGACIHTRNDIIGSQDTIHPSDNRVLSIREIMRLMTIPDKFIWTDEEKSVSNKAEFMRKYELNIRRCIGEAVPTHIMDTIAKKIKYMLDYQNFIDTYSPCKKIKTNKDNFYIKTYIEEQVLPEKKETGSFYTPQSVVYESLKKLNLKNYKTIKILEPAVGLGAFIPQIVSACYQVEKIEIDVVDIDSECLKKLKKYISSFNFHSSVKINYICEDFLMWDTDKSYDLVISNPPYFKLKSSDLKKYRENFNVKSDNIYAFFLKKFYDMADKLIFVIPKTFVMASDYEDIRKLYENIPVVQIIDYGVKYFKDVFIEILSIYFDKDYVEDICIENKLDKTKIYQKQKYIFHDKLWLLYRNKWFDKYIKKLYLDCFDFYRDRQITNKHLKKSGKYWVIKSKNILNSGAVVSIPGYDKFVDDIENFGVKQFLNSKAIIMPNFTYNTRAAILPDNCIANGSIAFMIPKKKIKNKSIDLTLYATEEFREYYAIIKNRSKFTINIDNCSVYYIGIKK